MMIYAYDDRKGLAMLEEALRTMLGDKMTFKGFTDSTALMMAAETTGYDIAFADVEYNGNSGMRLLGELSRQYPHSNYIGVTNNGSVLTALTMHRIHACDYLVKPYYTEQLADTLENLRFPVGRYSM